MLNFSYIIYAFTNIIVLLCCCMRVYARVCFCACMFLRVYVCSCACMFLPACVFLPACMFLRVYVPARVCSCACMFVSARVCFCALVCVYYRFLANPRSIFQKTAKNTDRSARKTSARVSSLSPHWRKRTASISNIKPSPHHLITHPSSKNTLVYLSTKKKKQKPNQQSNSIYLFNQSTSQSKTNKTKKTSTKKL